MDKLSIDLERMTLGDLLWFEEYTGTTVQELQAGNPSAKQLIALAYLTLKKTDPDVSIEDAMAVELVQLSDEQDPTTAGEDAPAS